MFKTCLILFLILAVFAVGGGGFYYFEIYQPRTYAALLLSLYHKLERVGLQPDASSLQDKTDYKNALNILEERINVLESIQGELVHIQPPKRMADIQKEFTDYLAFTRVQHAHAVQLVSFIKEASELHNAIKSIYGGSTSEQNEIVTMGDLQKKLNERIPPIQIIAEKMFNKEIIGLTNPSFAELRVLWENGNPIFDIMLTRTKAINQHTPLSQIGNLFTPLEEKKIAIYNKNVEEFIKKLGDLIKQHSTYDLLAFRDFPNVSSIEVSERALRFYQTIQTLKESYAQ